MTSTQTELLHFGYDKGSENGDVSALCIKEGDTITAMLYGADADAVYGLLQARSTDAGVVRVCPDCDIADCKHLRPAVDAPSDILKIAEKMAEGAK